MFSLNDLVVYPAQGVGIIERIDRQEINGGLCLFYVVRIRSNNVTLMVPVDNAGKVGLRPLVPQAEAERILQSLRNDTGRTVYTGQNWNRRFREYSERLKNHALHVVAEVLRELLLIGKTKELSFGERRLQELAMNLVTGELAEVLNVPKDALREELLDIYTQCCRQKNSPLPDALTPTEAVG
ncbi:MAG: CarD family transcriptional regulator [Desulfovibrio sp.]|nr:CarD family transcriptional regulator [Desulfovibrio sp.]